MTPAVPKWVHVVFLAGLALFATAGWALAGSPDSREPSRSTPGSPALFIVRRHLDGEITKLDAKAHTVVVKTSSGKLNFTHAPSAGPPLAKGDSVLVEVALLSAPSLSGASPRDASGRSPDPAIVRQRVEATVTGINHSRGIVKLQTPAGPVELDLPTSILDRLKKDESVPAEIALVPLPPGATAERAERAGLAALLLSVFGKK